MTPPCPSRWPPRRVLSPQLAERLAPSAGQRDVLVHEYAQVDLALVARGSELAHADDRTYVREVARSLPS